MEDKQATQSTNSILDPLPDSNDETWGSVERISKKDIRPINDPKCKHEFVEDPGDQTDFYIAMTCKHCIQGYLKPKKV